MFKVVREGQVRHHYRNRAISFLVARSIAKSGLLIETACRLGTVDSRCRRQILGQVDFTLRIAPGNYRAEAAVNDTEVLELKHSDLQRSNILFVRVRWYVCVHVYAYMHAFVRVRVWVCLSACVCVCINGSKLATIKI